MLKLPPSEKSFWQEFSPGAIFPELTTEIETDVVIIGGGIAGLSCAYFLKQAGKKVVVLEKETLASGTTGRTTGKVTSQHGLIYKELIGRHGKRAIKLYAQANQAAVDAVANIIKTEKIDCDWQAVEHSVYTTNKGNTKKYRAEASAAASLGLPASFVSDDPLPFKISARVKFKNQGKFNSQKYLLGLAKSINGGGSYIFENSAALIIQGGSNCTVKTKNGIVRSKDIVVATHVPTFPLLARVTYAALEYPTESFLIAAKIKKQFSNTFISTDSQHYSILPIKIKNQKYVLIGGEGGNIPGIRLSKEKRYAKLADYAEKYFGAYKVTNKWSDMDYMAYDSLPLVGRLYPWSQHVYVATGFMKWGLSNGTAAGLIIRDLITEGSSKWAECFNPHRIGPIKNIPRVAIKQIFN